MFYNRDSLFWLLFLLVDNFIACSLTRKFYIQSTEQEYAGNILKFKASKYKEPISFSGTFPDARRVFLKLNSGVNYTNDSAWVSWEIQKQPPDYDYIQHFDGKLFVSVK